MRTRKTRGVACSCLNLVPLKRLNVALMVRSRMQGKKMVLQVRLMMWMQEERV